MEEDFARRGDGPPRRRRRGEPEALKSEREVFRMASGGEEGCRLVRDQRFIKELVDALGSWIEAQDLAVPGLIEVAEGQPLSPKLTRAIHQDPDKDFLLQVGLLVGILEPLPRTPHIFERQEKWPLENTPWETFKERFGDDTAIAALAVIVEDKEKDKKRLIHDATHGVRVNHRIKCRDKLRAPGAREKKQLLLEAMDKKERPFSILNDIKKALAKEQRFLACQLDARDGAAGQLDNSCVYINKVGTFGVNCASYWWTRVAACGIRGTHHLLGRCPIDMLLYADDLESLATPQLLLPDGARVSLQMAKDQKGDTE